MINTKIL